MTVDEAVKYYCAKNNLTIFRPRAVMFDMDGVLYDSMPGHAVAWKQVCNEYGIEAEAEEFYAYEGRTGASTIDILIHRQFGRHATEEECKAMYKRKSEIFAGFGTARVMPGAQTAVAAVLAAGAVPVLVTGSGQGTLLEKLDADYDGAFTASRRVTAYDVTHGKPDPEPYLKGVAKAGVTPCEGIGVDNAPLGVESSSSAGLFTIGVRTGPLKPGSLIEVGANIELNSMEDCTKVLEYLLSIR